LSDKLSIGRDVKVVIKPSDIAKKSLVQLERDLYNEYQAEITAEEMAASILKLKTFYDVIEHLTEGFPELRSIYDYDVNKLNYSPSVRKCLETIKSKSSYFVKLGSAFELMYENDIVFSNSNNPKMARNFKKATSTVVSENLKQNNKLTTDVKVLLEKANKMITYGMTLKSNSNTFRKTNVALTSDDTA
jgi:hypothetical protein